MKISIHRALTELKMIDKKIASRISGFTPVGLKQKGKLVNNLYQEEEFNKNAKERYQSITDLIKRKINLKSAVTKANSETMVTIGDKKMSIAEAIQYKSIVVAKEVLLKELKNVFDSAKSEKIRVKNHVEQNALSIAKDALAKDNVKIGDSDVITVTKPYIEANEVHVVDPIGIEKEIESLENEIESFKTDVDAVLSEINAITLIEVE